MSPDQARGTHAAAALRSHLSIPSLLLLLEAHRSSSAPAAPALSPTPDPALPRT